MVEIEITLSSVGVYWSLREQIALWAVQEVTLMHVQRICQYLYSTGLVTSLTSSASATLKSRIRLSKAALLSSECRVPCRRFARFTAFDVLSRYCEAASQLYGDAACTTHYPRDALQVREHDYRSEFSCPRAMDALLLQECRRCLRQSSGILVFSSGSIGFFKAIKGYC
jgi:hypothetical protein